MQYFLAVKGIIRKDGKILVLKRSDKDDHKPGIWETVGGGMDKEESPQGALLREISEETGQKFGISGTRIMQITARVQYEIENIVNGRVG